MSISWSTSTPEPIDFPSLQTIELVKVTPTQVFRHLLILKAQQLRTIHIDLVTSQNSEGFELFSPEFLECPPQEWLPATSPTPLTSVLSLNLKCNTFDIHHTKLLHMLFPNVTNLKLTLDATDENDVDSLDIGGALRVFCQYLGPQAQGDQLLFPQLSVIEVSIWRCGCESDAAVMQVRSDLELLCQGRRDAGGLLLKVTRPIQDYNTHHNTRKWRIYWSLEANVLESRFDCKSTE